METPEKRTKKKTKIRMKKSIKQKRRMQMVSLLKNRPQNLLQERGRSYSK